MKRTTLIVAGVLAASLAAGAVMAQGGPPDDRSGHGKAMWQELDADGDGEVTLAEMNKHHQEMFAEADADGNGAISHDEMRAHMQKKHAALRAKRMGDTNGDGVVSKAEFDARKDAHFDELDSNDDGVISADEMAAGRGHHRWRGR